MLRIAIAGSACFGSLDQMGIFDGRFNGQQLLYYTILSNFIIALSYGFLLYCTALKSRIKGSLVLCQIPANLRGALTAMIVVTGLVYHIILVPNVANLNQYGLYTLSNFLVHTFVPLGVFMDWMCGGPLEKNYRIKPFTWLVIPMGYYLLSVVYASFNVPLFKTGSTYAYFFIDASKIGWESTILNVLLFAFFFLVLSYGLRGLKTCITSYMEKILLN